MSPSTRRAWIEIQGSAIVGEAGPEVALHPEGVDRNCLICFWYINKLEVALHPEGVDRNEYDLDVINTLPSRPPPGGRG